MNQEHTIDGLCQRVIDLKSSLDFQRQDRKKDKGQIQYLLDKKHELEAENERLKAELAESENWQEAYSTLYDKASEMEAELHSLKAELAKQVGPAPHVVFEGDVTVSLEEYDRVSKQVVAMCDLLGEQNGTIWRLRADLTAEREKVAALEKELANHRNFDYVAYLDLRQKNAVLTAQVAELEGLLPEAFMLENKNGQFWRLNTPSSEHIMRIMDYQQRKKEGGNGPA